MLNNQYDLVRTEANRGTSVSVTQHDVLALLH